MSTNLFDRPLPINPSSIATNGVGTYDTPRASTADLDWFGRAGDRSHPISPASNAGIPPGASIEVYVDELIAALGTPA